MLINSLCEESAHSDVRQIIDELRSSLEQFDKRWVGFEQVHNYASNTVLVLCAGIDANRKRSKEKNSKSNRT
jgi:hypothetical protein